MLKNELDILAAVFTRQLKGERVFSKNNKSDFSDVVSESCSHARKAWAAAAFTNVCDDTLRRYYNYHFSFLNGLIAENCQGGYLKGINDLYQLLEHLLTYYGKFIDKAQPVALGFIEFRMDTYRIKYEQFIRQLMILKIDELLENYLRESLAPIYTVLPAEALKLSDLLYREELITALAGKRIHPELMSTESLISTLISFNFNHIHFLSYLRKSAINGIQHVPPANYATYFGGLISSVPAIDVTNNRSYDASWPHISTMYKDWLSDYGTLLTLTMPQGHGSTVTKVPLTISVRQLACMIRTFYEAGFYGNISLTAIFDHAAAVFTTKRQERISAESIANAYYNIAQSSALKVTRMLGHAIDFLKPYCFPA